MPCRYGTGLDGNDTLLSHYLYSFCILCRFSVVVGDDRSHIGGSDDMRSLVIISVVLVGYCGTLIFWGCEH